MAWRRGVTLIELIAAAVILGVLALIVVPNVVSSAHLSKHAAFATTLATLQDGSDQFYGIAGAYPTYAGTAVANQPGACPDAFEVQPQAATATGSAFIPAFLRSAPQASPSWAGLNLAAGTQVYYGVASGGLVFATQVPPEQNGDEWTLAGTPVYTQTNASPQDPTTLGFLCQGVTPLQGPSLTATAQVSGSQVTVSGQAPPNDALTISVMDPQVQQVTASSTGSYSATFSNAYTAGQPTIITVTDGAGHLAEVIIQADGTIVSSTGTPAGTSSSVTLQAGTSTLVAGSGSTTSITGTVTVNGQPAAGVPVTLSVTDGSLSATTVTTGSQGTFSVTYTAGATAGTSTVTATADGATGTVSLTLTGISSVQFTNVGQNMTMTITGVGFGSLPETLPYSGDTDNFLFTDDTRDWSAGYAPAGNLVTLNYASWSNTGIGIDGFSGDYGDFNWVVEPGDTVTIDVYVNGAATPTYTWTGTLP